MPRFAEGPAGAPFAEAEEDRFQLLPGRGEQVSDNLRFDNTDAYAARTLSRKTVAAEALISAVRLAIETVGGLGYSRTCDIEMRYRDVHGSLFHPLPRAKQTRFSGRVLLGHSPIG